MPRDPNYEFTWPIFCAMPETLDETPKVITLTDAPLAGDVALVPSLHVVGRTVDGKRGNIHVGGYTLVNNDGTLELHTDNESVASIGIGGLDIAVSIVGTELQMIATGLAGIRILWGVQWRAFEVPVGS